MLHPKMIMRVFLPFAFLFGLVTARRAPSLEPVIWGNSRGWDLDDSYFGGPDQFHIRGSAKDPEVVREVTREGQ
jgi:hypothetical protein